MAEFNCLYDFDDDLLDDFAKKRDICENCTRPMTVCLCPYMTQNTLEISKNIKIWIFQHPAEIKRPLRTTLILEKCLSAENFQILAGRKFSVERFPELKDVYENEHTYVLYPSDNAVSVETLPSSIKAVGNGISLKFHVIVIDGTWVMNLSEQMKNEYLQLKIETDKVSVYKIRTQPKECFLSTLETVAVILSKLEEKEEVYNDLIKPLEALCNFQFDNGALEHQSKEYLLVNGLYNRPISIKNSKKLILNTKLRANHIFFSNNASGIKASGVGFDNFIIKFSNRHGTVFSHQ